MRRKSNLSKVSRQAKRVRLKRARERDVQRLAGLTSDRESHKNYRSKNTEESSIQDVRIADIRTLRPIIGKGSEEDWLKSVKVTIHPEKAWLDSIKHHLNSDQGSLNPLDYEKEGCNGEALLNYGKDPVSCKEDRKSSETVLLNSENEPFNSENDLSKSEKDLSEYMEAEWNLNPHLRENGSLRCLKGELDCEVEECNGEGHLNYGEDPVSCKEEPMSPGKDPFDSDTDLSKYMEVEWNLNPNLRENDSLNIFKNLSDCEQEECHGMAQLNYGKDPVGYKKDVMSSEMDPLHSQNDLSNSDKDLSKYVEVGCNPNPHLREKSWLNSMKARLNSKLNQLNLRLKPLKGQLDCEKEGLHGMVQLNYEKDPVYCKKDQLSSEKDQFNSENDLSAADKDLSKYVEVEWKRNSHLREKAWLNSMKDRLNSKLSQLNGSLKPLKGQLDCEKGGLHGKAQLDYKKDPVNCKNDQLSSEKDLSKSDKHLSRYSKYMEVEWTLRPQLKEKVWLDRMTHRLNYKLSTSNGSLKALKAQLNFEKDLVNCKKDQLSSERDQLSFNKDLSNSGQDLLNPVVIELNSNHHLREAQHQDSTVAVMEEVQGSHASDNACTADHADHLFTQCGSASAARSN